MLLNKFNSFEISQKLILFFSIGLFLVIITVIISSVILRKIEESKYALTDSSIPALVSVNTMSTYAHDLAQSTIKMSESKTIYELNTRTDESFESIHNMHIELEGLKNNLQYSEIIKNVKSTLLILEVNLNLEYNALASNLQRQINYNNETILMREALEKLTQLISLKKINVKADISEHTKEIRNKKEYEKYTTTSILNLEVISDLIARSAELRKDLIVIDEASTRNSVLGIEQEFDHSLRAITREVVSNKELQLQDVLGKHILTLIKYGQDTPDIFELKLNLINTHKKVYEIHGENFLLTKKINENVNQLSESVKDSTENSANTLSNTILTSKYIFYLIALLSIIIFIFIIVKFVYKDIVLRLSNLSDVTNMLSKENLNFEIDTSGNDEFSKLSLALDTLKNQISERKVINEKLRKQSILLKRSNEDLSLFAYVASHDLQEPLRAISSYSKLLSKRYSNELDKDADKFIDYVLSGCSRMESLIDGLLKFSRVDTQNTPKESIWIEKILRQIKNDLKIKINETYSLISWDEMPTIYADPVQIKTVFQNIISNAIKYNLSKPPKIHIKACKESEYWKFYITDNGVGIEEKHHEKIFLIFERLHTRDKYPGTGIGLSICKKIVERHGGKITLESKPNEGSTFIFTLPIDDRYTVENINSIAA